MTSAFVLASIMKRALITSCCAALTLASVSGLSQGVEDTEDRVHTLLRQAEVSSTRQMDDASKKLKEALRLASEDGLDSLRFETLNSLSDNFRRRNISDSALHFSIQAGLFAEAQNNPSWQALSLLKMARIYRDLKLDEKAESYVEEASKLELPSKDLRTKGLILQAKSIGAWNRGDKAESHRLIAQALQLIDDSGELELRQILLMDQALQYFGDGDLQSGLSIYDSLLGMELKPITRYTIFHNTITIYLDSDQPQAAYAVAQAFLSAVESEPDPAYVTQAIFDHVQVLEALGNYEEALKQYFLLDELEDSLYTAELSQALSDMQARFDVEQKEQQLSLTQSELENTQLEQRNQLISGIALILILGALLFISRQRLQNRKLAAASEQREKEVYRLRNIELKDAFDQIEEKNREITDSITYAKRIQEAIMPPMSYWKQHLPDSFIYYRPKDIVAGDFYWMEVIPATNDRAEQVIFAAADCTGHGVPGAMVSVLCCNALNRAVREYHHQSPAHILNETLRHVVERFERSHETVRDGMDIAICRLDRESKTLYYSGAHNPLWIITTREIVLDGIEHRILELDGHTLYEIKADKQAIGLVETPQPFTEHKIQLASGDRFYVFSDGFADQFGGPKGKKFKYKTFKELLIRLHEVPIEEQSKRLDQTFEEWRGEMEQVDDVCVIGAMIS